MKKLIFVFILVFNIAFGQNEDKIWYFGGSTGLNFNTTPPTLLTNSAMFTYDNSSTICDSVGNLLFYTNGVTVWNKLHNIMVNGTGLLGSNTAGQSALIVRQPGTSVYYIFTVKEYAAGNCYYSTVDMNLNAGLGGVVQKNVLLFTNTTEKLDATYNCSTNSYKVIGHTYGNNSFYVYELSTTGLNTTPTINSIGLTHNGGTYGFAHDAAGQLTISPNGLKIAVALNFSDQIQIFDFNFSTGLITNPTTITLNNAWGLAFSPNSSILYCTGWTSNSVGQINLNSPTLSIANIGTTSGANPGYGAGYPQLGPNNKIYIAKYGSTSISVINNPNSIGTSCGFVNNAIFLGGYDSQAGLSRVAKSVDPITTTSINQNCSEITVTSTINPNVNVSWNFGDGTIYNGNNTTHQYASPGTYIVKTIIDGCIGIDTIIDTVFIQNTTTNANVSSGCDLQGTFYADSINLVSGVWNFGDGQTSNLFSTNHSYATAGNYNPYFIANFTNGCVDTFFYSLNIAQGVTSSFTSNNITCTYDVSFTNTSTNANSYQWYLGGTLVSTLVSPMINFANDGNFIVTLIAENNGCLDTVFQNITINPAPNSIFNISNNCSLSLAIQNNSTNAANFLWNWGDGNQSSGLIGNYSYASAGNYTVTLIASDGICTDTSFQNVTIQNPPIADFSITSYCNNTVTIQNNSLNTSNYYWDWGNGQTSTGNQNIHQYPNNNDYTITLIATNNGCSDTTFQQVDTNDIPIASFIAIPNCNNGVDIINNSQNSTSYLWNWGNNVQDTGSFQNYTYATSGNYTITLITYNNGCSDTISQNISVSNLFYQPFNIATDCSKNIQILNFYSNATSLFWNWGDGQTSTGNSLSHSYTNAGNYIITLILSTSNCTDTIIDSVTVYDFPNADFNYISNCNQTIDILNLSSNYNTLSWNWGNGQSSNGIISNYFYDTPGSYTITLIASNGSCFDTILKPIVIDTGIIANFSTLQDCSLGLNITNNSLYTDSLRIFWGDGTFITNSTFHLYNSVGSYDITFIVYGRNCSDTSTSTILIDTLPKSTILYQLSNCHDTIVLNSQYASNSYLWNFGDGQTSTQSSISHVYAQPGTYTIQLTNSNNNCKDSITQSIFISTTPNADFNYNLSCQGELETTINTIPGWIYSWNLGDGTTSNAPNVLHNYSIDSTYIVTLVANNGYCSDSVSKEIIFIKYTNYSIIWNFDTCEAKLFLNFNPSLNDSISIDFGDGNVTTNLTSFHQYLYPNIYQAQVIIRPGTNCADTISNSIDVSNSEFNLMKYIPNSFSPNNDGLNDFFVIPDNTCIDFEIEVYSRWGALTFQSKKSGDKWDGKFNGIDLPSGVYVLKVKTKYQDTYSTINIIR